MVFRCHVWEGLGRILVMTHAASAACLLECLAHAVHRILVLCQIRLLLLCPATQGLLDIGTSLVVPCLDWVGQLWIQHWYQSVSAVLIHLLVLLLASSINDYIQTDLVAAPCSSVRELVAQAPKKRAFL